MQFPSKNREALLLVGSMLVLLVAAAWLPPLALAVPATMAWEWLSCRQHRPSFDPAAYSLTPEEQIELDAAAAVYVDARRALNRVESKIRQSGFSIDEEGRLDPVDDVGALQSERDAAQAALDPEPVLRLARLPLARADAAFQNYAAQQGAKWGTLAYLPGFALGWPLSGAYGWIAGAVASVFAYLLASHLTSRSVINFLLALPQAMPQFRGDQQRREQVKAAARALVEKDSERSPG